MGAQGSRSWGKCVCLCLCVVTELWPCEPKSARHGEERERGREKEKEKEFVLFPPNWGAAVLAVFSRWPGSGPALVLVTVYNQILVTTDPSSEVRWCKNRYSLSGLTPRGSHNSSPREEDHTPFCGSWETVVKFYVSEFEQIRASHLSVTFPLLSTVV